MTKGVKPNDTANDDVVDAFITASRALVGVAVRSINAAGVDVTIAQHRVLVLLASHGSQTVGTLAEQLGIDASNGTRICDRLERLGLVARARSSLDGRAVNVSLTPAGRALLEEVRAHRARDLQRILRDVSPADIRSMVRALSTFARAAHEVDEVDWATHTI